MSCCVTPPFSRCQSILDLSGGTTFQLGCAPPPCFFNLGGIYGQRFVYPVVTTFDRLYARIQATDPSNVVDPFNNKNERLWVQRLSQSQRMQYEAQLAVFRRVYAYNLEAYNCAACGKSSAPFYYKFQNQTELSQYTAGVALMQKLYEVSERYPLQCLFFLPFPPFSPI
jgi:hypothetical protein